MKEAKIPPNLLVEKFEALFAEYNQLKTLKREYEFFRSVHAEHKHQTAQNEPENGKTPAQSDN